MRDAVNVINPGCISPVAKNYLDQFIPHIGLGNRRQAASRRRSTRITSSPASTTRVSSKNTLYGHFFKDNYERISSPGNLDYVPESNVADIKNYGLTDTHTFSPTFLNEVDRLLHGRAIVPDGDRAGAAPRHGHQHRRRAIWASG